METTQAHSPTHGQRPLFLVKLKQSTHSLKLFPLCVRFLSVSPSTSLCRRCPYMPDDRMSSSLLNHHASAHHRTTTTTLALHHRKQTSAPLPYCERKPWRFLIHVELPQPVRKPPQATMCCSVFRGPHMDKYPCLAQPPSTAARCRYGENETTPMHVAPFLPPPRLVEIARCNFSLSEVNKFSLSSPFLL